MDIQPDTVIFATGYTHLDNYPSPRDAELRNIVRSGDEDIAFIGYVR
jgi:dimethylaniline monooxygenase (N-oxide forming)